MDLQQIPFWGLSIQNLIEPVWTNGDWTPVPAGMWNSTAVLSSGWRGRGASTRLVRCGSAPAPPSVDVQALFDYDEVVRFGVGCRNESALSGILTLNILDELPSV